MTKKAAPAGKERSPESRLSSPENFDVGPLCVGGLVGLADCDMNRTAADRDSGAVLLWSEAELRHVRVPAEAVGLVTGLVTRTAAQGGDLVEVLWPQGPAIAFARRLVVLGTVAGPHP